LKKDGQKEKKLNYHKIEVNLVSSKK